MIAELLGLGGGLIGLLSDNAKNKRSKEELAIQRRLADKQVEMSDYLMGVSRDLQSRPSTINDGFGGVYGFDPATGQYRATARPNDAAIIGASDKEELNRYTLDQELRRAGLGDAERLRSEAVPDAQAAQRDLSLFKQGIGVVDPNTVASALATSRKAAINAGYDDAMRAGQTLQLRTGSSAVGSGLDRLARERIKAQAQIGTPEVEGLQIADALNKDRLGQKASMYDMFSTKGSNFYDAAYGPSDRPDAAYDKAMNAAKFDLGKTEVAMGGAGTAAAGIGSAAATRGNAFRTSEASRVHDPFGKFISGLSGAAGAMNFSKVFG